MAKKRVYEEESDGGPEPELGDLDSEEDTDGVISDPWEE